MNNFTFLVIFLQQLPTDYDNIEGRKSGMMAFLNIQDHIGRLETGHKYGVILFFQTVLASMSLTITIMFISNNIEYRRCSF